MGLPVTVDHCCCEVTKDITDFLYIMPQILLPSGVSLGGFWVVTMFWPISFQPEIKYRYYYYANRATGSRTAPAQFSRPDL